MTVDPTKTIRERLRESMAATVTRKPIRIDVPERPGFVVEFALLDPLKDDEKLQGFAEQTGADKNDNPDAWLRAATLLLIDCCRGIYLDGEQWLTDDGEPVTFASSELRDSVGISNWVEAVWTFYGSKADAMTASNIVSTRSGMTGRSKESPTRG